MNCWVEIMSGLLDTEETFRIAIFGKKIQSSTPICLNLFKFVGKLLPSTFQMQVTNLVTYTCIKASVYLVQYR